MTFRNWKDDVKDMTDFMGATPESRNDWRSNLKKMLERMQSTGANGVPRIDDVVVASFDSTDKVKASADYVCTGVGDQEVINEAILFASEQIAEIQARVDTYPSTTVRLSNGTFKVDGSINLKNRVEIIGNSPQWGSSIYLNDAEEASFPETDWYLFNLPRSVSGNYPRALLKKVYATSITYNDWEVPISLKGMFEPVPTNVSITLDGGMYYSGSNHSIIQIAPGAINNVILLENCEIETDGGGSVPLIDLSNGGVDCYFFPLGTVLLFESAIGIKLGSNNPNIRFEGSVYYQNITNLFNGTSTNMNGIGNWLEREGTATIPQGATYIDVTHGRAKTPTANEITITPTNNKGSGWWISNIGATTFRINVPTDPGATTATFAWSIK